LSSHESTQAAKAIRTFARNSAKSIRENLELEALTKETSEWIEKVITARKLAQSVGVGLNQGDFRPEADDDDEMDPVDDLEENMEDFKKLESLITSSNSFERFKEHFRLFVHPDEIRYGVLQEWPIKSSLSSERSISYEEVDWDLQSFVDNHVKDISRIKDLVTITGNSINAQALACRDYLSHTWPDVRNLLHGIEQLLANRSDRKLPGLYFYCKCSGTDEYQ
jgi:hypothetical protein